MTKTLLAIFLVCVVCVHSDDYRPNRYPDYVRAKKPKYYSSPPRSYKRPPVYSGYKSTSYSPPKNYVGHDEPYTRSYKPKVSKWLSNDGLEDEDLSNLIKQLSKQDLDKILEFAGEKHRDDSLEKYRSISNQVSQDASDVSVHKSRELDTDMSSYLINNIGQLNYEMEYTDNSRPPVNDNAFKPSNEVDNFSFNSPVTNVYNNQLQNGPSEFIAPPNPGNPQGLSDVPMYKEEPIMNEPFSFMNSHIQQELYSPIHNEPTASTLIESKGWKEEQVPQQDTMRDEQDYLLATSNKVPTIANAASYKVESFADLPLMDYNSKLDSVSSYHVPHYTVISPTKYAAPPPSSSYSPPSSSYSAPPKTSYSSPLKVPELETAPPASAATDQSDAHLKAIKIWSHKSKGTAYTLNDDGTLSLEKDRPRGVYGY